MTRARLAILLAIVAAAASACGAGVSGAGTGAADALAGALAAGGARGKADGKTQPRALALGQTARFVVDPDAARDTDKLGAFALNLEAGQTVALVLRAPARGEQPFEGWLRVVGPQRTVLTATNGQAALPMVDERDEVVVFTAPSAGRTIIIAGDAELAFRGELTLTALPLSQDPGALDLSLTHRGLRVVTARLRDAEAAIASYRGRLVEGADGTLSVGGYDGVPLRERAQLNGRVASVNTLRRHLFRLLAEAVLPEGDAGTDALAQRAGRLLAELWNAWRALPSS